MKQEMINSLQEQSLWIVPQNLKDEVERELIKYSDKKAILFQRVTTISLFYEEMLKKHQYYHVHRITHNDKIKKIYELIVEGNYRFICIDGFKDVMEMIKTMIDHSITEMVDTSSLPAFTANQLEECYDLYHKYMQYLKNNDLYDGNYDRSFYRTFKCDEKIYVSCFGNLTINEKNFLDHFNVCYVESDTNEVIEQGIYKVLDPKSEMKSVLHDIVVKVNEGNQLDDFMVYVPADYIPQFTTLAKQYRIPMNGEESVNDPMKHAIRLIFDYLVTYNTQRIIELIYLTNGKELAWYYDRQYQTGYFKGSYIERQLVEFNECKSMNDYSTLLLKILDILHLKRYLERYVEIKNYIASFDLELPCTLIDYFNILLLYFPDLVSNNHSMQAINVQSIQHISIPRKYTYILGCNEEKFPTISKDGGLLLEEGKKAFGMTTLIDEIENEKVVIDHIVRQATHLYLSYSVGTYGGDELLVSTYLNELKNKYHIPNKKFTIHEIASIEAERDLLLYTNDESLQAVETLSQDYHTSKNQPGRLILNKEKDLSVSGVEAYNKCPFKFYITYDLGIKKWKNRALQINDYGTLRHEIVEKCSAYINGQEQDIDTIIHELCNQALMNAEQSSLQEYFIHEIEKQMQIIVRILRYQNAIGEFKITQHEVDIKHERNDYSIHGRFDRLDEVDGLARVVDYKSSNKTIDLDLARAGFNIQMLLYLSMLPQQEAGVLYMNMANRILKKAKPNEAKIEDLYKLFKMNGLIINDERVIDLMNPDHKNDILPLNFNKDGSLGGRGNSALIDQEALDQLIEDIYQRVDVIMDEIFEVGNINIDPAVGENDAMHRMVNPCTYCEFSNICLKDIFYNTGREIKIGGEENESEQNG